LALFKRSETVGKLTNFGGPRVYSFKVLLELLLTVLDRQRILIPIPFGTGRKSGLLELVPNPPVTPHQVRLLN
jgi:uncharacterized protein YbjT (DUF2867 family)